MNLLQNYVFVPLDLFLKNVQDKGIRNKLDAWLAFLSIDEPDMIIKLTEEYPEFKVMYQQVYEMCRNVEGLMGIFSEELKIMDRNTVKYMVDQMQDELDMERCQRQTAEQERDQAIKEAQFWKKKTEELEASKEVR